MRINSEELKGVFSRRRDVLGNDGDDTGLAPEKATSLTIPARRVFGVGAAAADMDPLPPQGYTQA